jgi:uncharacterized protein (TIGR01777 family)
MRVAVTGASGLIGSALVRRLEAEGHTVCRITRRGGDARSIRWDPANSHIDAGQLDGLDAVVHLAGAGVGDHRWSSDYKEEILQSRVRGTATIAQALVRLDKPPSVLVSASAVGYYGVRGGEVLEEDSGAGSGFLADVCVRWEEATAPASAAGIRVAHSRTGVVLSAAGGALKRQLLPWRLGAGARLGSGRQFLSWITRRDVVQAIVYLIASQELSGPFNVTSPAPVPNAEFTRALGRAVHRPAVLAVPEVVLRLAVGDEMAGEFLLASQRAMPTRLLAAGFAFADPDLAGALAVALDDQP